MKDYKLQIYKAVKKVVTEVEQGDVARADEYCDYCLPCFKFSKIYRKSPKLIADELAAKVKVKGMAVTSLNGYLNFTIDRKVLITDLFGEKQEFKPFKGKTICIDYSSVNIAKPFHIGHLMTTVIGGSLYNIYSALGAKVVGINHLGDFGTQFGGLIAAYRRWGDEEKLNKDGLNELLALYVRFNKEEKDDAVLAEEAREWSSKIERGDEYATKLFEKFKAITIEQAKKVYDRLHIKFDSYLGESFYVDKVPAVEQKLKSKDLSKISDGAEIVELPDMPPALIRRSDGATLYIARDLAAAYYRKQTYDFDKCLYVVASHQQLHFKQLFKVLELLGESWASDMVHVSFGMVSVNGLALSSRNGNVVFLDDVLSAAVEKAKEIISSHDLENKDEVAEDVGVGAIVFDALYDGRLKDKDFSISDALNFDGETGPYVQYTYARCCSVLSKSGFDYNFDKGILTNDEAYEVVKLIVDFDDVVYNAAIKYEPSIISRRLIKICQAFNRFYNGQKIMCGGEEQNAYLALTQKVADCLEYGLKLILLNSPKRM